MNKTKQRGYVLMLVLILTFLMATATLTVFAVLHRYEQFAKRDIEWLRMDVLDEKAVTTAENVTQGEGLS